MRRGLQPRSPSSGSRPAAVCFNIAATTARFTRRTRATSTASCARSRARRFRSRASARCSLPSQYSTSPSTPIVTASEVFRGHEWSVFMNPSDIARVGLKDGEHIGLATAIEDGTHRHVDGFVGRPYNVPEGCLAGYYPECNPLVPLSHHAHGSFVPAVKGVPVRIVKVGRQP